MTPRFPNPRRIVRIPEKLSGLAFRHTGKVLTEMPFDEFQSMIRAAKARSLETPPPLLRFLVEGRAEANR